MGTFYYPYGNTLPEDLFSHLVQPESSALLLGCGDLRNMFHTLSEAARKESSSFYSFTINDLQPEIIARNILILCAIDANVTPMQLAQFWYSLEMDDVTHSYWLDQMKRCLNVDWSNSKSVFGYHLDIDPESLAQCKRIWKAWLENFDWTKDSMNRKRDNVLKPHKLDYRKISSTFYQSLLSIKLSDNSKQKLEQKLENECFEVLSTGCFVRGNRLNPSLHRIGHALTVMDSFLLLGEKFDVIETSNLADHIGLLSLLVSGSVILNNECSILKACSFLFYNFAASRQEYLDIVTGLSEEAFPTLLGLELKSLEKSDWLSSISAFPVSLAQLIASQGRNYEFFVFRKAPTSDIPVAIDSSSFILGQLVNCALKTSASYYVKVNSLGSANTTPAIFSKLIAFAFAQQRITCSVSSSNQFPFPEPAKLFQNLYNLDDLKGNMSELFLFAQLYGFNLSSADLVGPSRKASGLVPTPRYAGVLTPHVFVELKAGPVNHNIQSIELADLKNDKSKISFYLPPFTASYKSSDIKVTTYVAEMRGSLAIPIPASAGFSLTNLKIEKTEKYDQAHLTKAAFIARKCFMKIEYVDERAAGYSVKVQLDSTTQAAKFVPIEKEGLFLGLLVDQRQLDMRFSCRAKLKSCKIHRKSGFILLELDKAQNNFVDTWPVLCVNDLPAYTDAKIGSTLGLMYFGQFQDVKSGKAKVSSLSRADQLLYELKDNMQIIFIRAMENYPFILLLKQSIGVAGAIIYHGLYEHFPLDSSHTNTSVLDVSIAFFEMKDMSVFGKLYESRKNPPQLIMPDEEFEEMKRLLNTFQQRSVDHRVHAAVSAIGGEGCFKRAVISPIFSKNVKPIVDEGSKQRNVESQTRSKVLAIAQKLRKAALEEDSQGEMRIFGEFLEANQGAMEQMLKANPSLIEQMLKADPSAMEQMRKVNPSAMEQILKANKKG